MGVIVRKTMLCACLGGMLVFPSFLWGDEGWKSYMAIVREVVGDVYNPKEEDYDNVRETKIYKDNYLHTYQSVIDGKGKVIKKYNWWPDSERKINFSHSAKAVLKEKIISTKEELETGIVKSEFSVVNFSEQFGVCSVGQSFGICNSQDMMKTLIEIGSFAKDNKKVVGQLRNAIVLLGVKRQKGALLMILTALGVDAFNRIAVSVGEKIKAITDEDGNFVLSDADVRKYYPGFEKVLLKIRNLEGTEVRTVWVQGKGYTQIDIKFSTADVTEEDRKLLATMIYRMNPIGARHILPKDKERKIGSKWVITANDFAALFSICGIEFDKLSGEIWIRNRGTKNRNDFVDELDLGRKVVPVVTLDIDKNYHNEIKFVRKLKRNATLDLRMFPQGRLQMATIGQNETNVPTYIREINCEGDFRNFLKKDIRKGSLLKIVDMETGSVKADASYQQIRYQNQ